MKVEHFLLNYSSKKLNIPNFRLKYHQMPGFAWPATYMGVLGKVQMTSWSRFFSSLGVTKVFRLLVEVFHSIFCLLVSDSQWQHWHIWISHNFVTWWHLEIWIYLKLGTGINDFLVWNTFVPSTFLFKQNSLIFPILSWSARARGFKYPAASEVKRVT